MINITEFPKTITNQVKIAELQIVKQRDTKQIQSLDAAALKLLRNPYDTHMYVNELMKAKKGDNNEDNSWFPGNEDDHTTIQRRIVKEIRELIQKEELDTKKVEESRETFLDKFK